MLDFVPMPIAAEDRVPAHRLNEALRVTGMSQSELARRLGLTVVAVNRWCRGKAPVSQSRWIAVASVLGLPSDWQPPTPQ
jgi:transcriptional regulator with XRE-family HTH domain